MATTMFAAGEVLGHFIEIDIAVLDADQDLGGRFHPDVSAFEAGEFQGAAFGDVSQLHFALPGHQ